jgi:hypothetical protein
VQYVAFVLDHVSVVDWPAVMVIGFAESVTVGAGPIVEAGALGETTIEKFWET